MASVDMCEHDWPGTGCKECQVDRDKRNTASVGVKLLAGVLHNRTVADDLLLGKLLPSDVSIGGDVAVSLIDKALEEIEWMPIATAPTDDSEFLVGKYQGEQHWIEDLKELVWFGEPKWVFDVSHNENPQGPHTTRGWNHTNGALGGRATHWARCPRPPKVEGIVMIKKKEEVQDETTPSVHSTTDG